MRDALKAEYRSILEDYLGGAGESAVLRAYDFARRCLRGGLAPDDVMEFHVDLVESGLESRHDEMARARAQSLFIEVVMAFSLGYRQTLEELERANHELAQASQFKTRMLSMVAHDLTNHMTAIRIFATRLSLDATGASARYAQNILEVLGEQDALVQNLLDIGRIDSGRLHLTIAPQPLLTALRRVADRLAKTTSAHTFSVDGDEVDVLADPARLQQVLDNLIGNAVKYAPDGGAIRIQVSREGGHAVVEIADEGLGIAEDDLPHVFEPFYRGRAQDGRNLPGSGLGLSIVHSLVRLQGGSIRAESRLGEGTVIRFTLPLAASTCASADMAEEGASSVPEDRHRAPAR